MKPIFDQCYQFGIPELPVYLYIIIIYINTKIQTHTSRILHTDYIHDKYIIDYVKYKHTHKSKYHLHVTPESLT